jgi:hypothetical protein
MASPQSEMSEELPDSIDKLRKNGSPRVQGYLSVDLFYPRPGDMVCLQGYTYRSSADDLGDHNDREGRINSRFISSAHFGANDDMAILVDGGTSTQASQTCDQTDL